MGWDTDIPVDTSITKLPSGGYQVSAPEVVATAKRATPEEIAQEKASLAPTPYSGGAELARSAIGQGLGMGFGDEVEAALRSAFSDEEYKTIRDRLRAQQAQFGKDYPATKFASELAGGLALPVGAIGAGAKGLMTGASALGTLGKGAALGAGMGGVTGVGTSKEVSNIPSDFAVGAGTGAVIGGAAPSLINLSGRAVRAVADSLGLTNASKYATRKLAQKLDQDNLTPDDAKIILDEYRKLGVPDPVIADLGDNLRGLGYAVNAVPNKAKTPTAEFLQQRNENLAGSLVSGLEKKANVNSNGKFGFEYINDLEQKQAQAAKDAYPQAHSLDLPASPFRKFVDRPVFQQAYENAVKHNELFKGDPNYIQLPALEQLRNAQYINTNILHEIKKGLDSVIEKETEPLTGKMTKYGSGVTQVKTEFNNLIKHYNKDYATANAKFADSEGLKSAYRDGIDYMKMDTNELIHSLKKMKPAEKEAFRVGMLSQIKDKASKSLNIDITNLIFKSPRQKSALRYAFDNQKQFDDFVNQVEAQKQLLKTSKRVSGGSPTQSNILETEDAGLASDLLNTGSQIASGNWMGAASNLARKGAARVGLSPLKAENLQNILFNPHPTGQNQILDLIKAQAAKKAQQGAVKTSLQTPATYSSLMSEMYGLLGQ